MRPEKPTIQVRRRAVIAAGGVSLTLPAMPGVAADPGRHSHRLNAQIRRLESRHQARVGVHWIDPTRSTSYSHRGDERFAFCSTFKPYAAGALLERARRGAVDLRETQHITRESLVMFSSESADFVDYDLPLRWSAKVAVVNSDNAAANRLIDVLGGTAAVTAFARRLGDAEFRLDRREPQLNGATPDDERDTTTPRSIARGYQHLLLSDGLSAEDREDIQGWMIANVTSSTRIRAGLPGGWTAANKSGSGAYGTTNDVGVLRDPAGRPFVLALLTDRQALGEEDRGDPRLLAALTELLLSTLVDE